MIDEIHLKNVALIREATMVPAAGLTVLTGETGSGKTAFLSGLKLMVGDRGSAEMVRQDASYLEVEGRFFLAGDAGGAGDPAGADGEGIVVSRSITSDGRSRVRIDGAISSVRELVEQVGSTVDLCGQHEHQRLVKPGTQGQMLDSWVGSALEGPLRAYRAALDAAEQARRAYLDLVDLGKADDARIEEARFVISRMDEVKPREGEYDELLAEAKRMENLEDLARAATGAREALSGEGGALDSVGAAIAALESAASFDGRLGAQAKVVREAGYLLEDAARAVDALVPDLDAFDPGRLDELQQRIAAYQGLMRSYGPTVDEVLARQAAAQEVLASFEDRDLLLERARTDMDAAEARLAQAADELSRVRKGQAPDFEREVNAHLARLEMQGCSLTCAIERMPREKWGQAGPDQVEFLFQPGRNLEARPLSRIASGGEMSRVVLAVKAVLGDADEVETLVFDEVDAGVGGKTALAVGEVLKGLAETHQVIVVTHLPQIAVLADAHYVVERVGKAVPETRLHLVEGDARVSEIARMLSGAVDDTSLAHARELLRQATAS